MSETTQEERDELRYLHEYMEGDRCADVATEFFQRLLSDADHLAAMEREVREVCDHDLIMPWAMTSRAIGAIRDRLRAVLDPPEVT